MGSHTDDGSEAQCNLIKSLHYGCMEMRQDKDKMGFSKRHPKGWIPILDAPPYPAQAWECENYGVGGQYVPSERLASSSTMPFRLLESGS